MKHLSIHIYLAFILILVSFAGNSQSKFGNEWINTSKTYYKIKVAEDGIYRVKYEDLKAAGFTPSNVAGSELKLFNFGEEVALHINGTTFGPGSWFEFYGKKNTIGLDSFLFENWKRDLLNPDYSLVTDTNAYFLTISPETTNLRYTLVNPDYNNITLTPTPYYLHEEKVVYSKAFFKNVDGDVRNSYFESSEGFGSGVLQTSNTTINTSGYVESGPAPILSFRTGQNALYSKLEIRWNNVLKGTSQTNPILTTQHSYTLAKTEIKASNILNLSNTNNANDRHIIANVSLVYPRNFDFGNKVDFTFKLQPSTSKRLLEITSFKTENQSVFLYDINNNIRYSTKVNTDKVLAITNSHQKESTFVLANTGEGLKNVLSIAEFKPRKFDNKGQEYVIITHKALHATSPDYVQEYAEYRGSNIGGGYKTDIIDVQDIYDNFGYGIDRHFLSIKNLAGYMKKNWLAAKFVLIIGKGVEYPYMRTANDVVNNVDRIFYVPTFGYAGSDNMLFSEANYPDPHFAIGRIAARTKDDIKNYLDKVKQYEQAILLPQTIEDKYWMKKVLNLGGGKNDSEQSAIRYGLESMAAILGDTIFGADIKAFYKRSGDAVQFNVNEEINDIFDKGVNIINFFGHSAVGSWDFSIENPRNYSNFGRYPFINSYGCYSGNLHGTARGISESFVLEKDRGSIAFLASSGTAFIPSLTNYGQQFYNSMLNERRYKTFGESITSIAKKNRNTDKAELALYAQLTLHGDPALKLNIVPGTDYIFDGKNVKTNPSSLQTNLKDFRVEVDVLNLGAYKKDSLDLVFYHELPSGKIIDTIYVRKQGIANSEKIILTLKNYGSASVGKNRLLGVIDPKNQINEWPAPAGENNNDLLTNNQRGFEFFISDNFATAIYPPDFAMINTKDHFVLKASTSSVPVAKGNYVFQIDTTAYFNSPLKETGKVESEGGLITYVPKLAPVADRVFYWRVSPDSTSIEGYKWSVASFAFLPNEEEGWNQSHFFQFTHNEFQDLEISEETGRKFEFGKEYFNVRLRNKLWDEEDKPGYIIQNNNWASSWGWRFMDSGIGIIVNNQKNLFDLFNPAGGAFGSLNPSSGNSELFAFKTDTPDNRKKVIDFIESQIKSGYYLNFYTIQSNLTSDYKANEWSSDSLLFGKSIFTVLEKLGAKKVRQLEKSGPVPYALQLVNGKEGLLDEKMANNINETIECSSNLYRSKPRGFINSMEISKFGKIGTIKFKSTNKISGEDSDTINVYAQKLNQPKTLFYQNSVNGQLINPNNDELLNLNLQYRVSDIKERTPMQLNFWRVSYDALPDAAISYVKSDPNPTGNELKQGEKVKIFYDVTNVNYVNMDSILVKYTYIGSDNQAVINYKKLGKLLAGQKLSDAIEFTVGAGNTREIRMVIEINPDNQQPELNSYNNTLTKQFGIGQDKTNPLLDVVFDGIHIMDGDIVSPRPEIMVTLEDDNVFLPVTDPNLFEIKLDTGRNQIIEIPMNSPQIKFTPAGQGNKISKILYYPQLKEGEYKLIVQAKDATGNKSGVNPRTINFKVIERQSISQVINYPNPFSTSTQFVFTVTGAEVPDIMSISIMTLSGKVVREITKEELGPIRIGINRSEYKWDGTDEYGSKLANGVYLYKVNTRKKDKSAYEQYSNEKIDSFFKEGFGKLVILR
jgi:hypothetical protein